MDELNNAENYFREFAKEFIAYLPNLLAAILLLVFGWWFIKIIVRYANKMFTRRNIDPAIQKFSLTIINWALKILLFVIVIGQLGVETTSLIAVLGAAGLAIGLALQGSLSNFAGGVIIILMKPFKLGDWIEVNGISGSVKDISLFYTKVNTFGNQLAVIPNGELSNDNIINYSAESTRRDSISIGISYNSDIKLAKKILMELLEEQENINNEPVPQVLVAELAESSVNLSVRYWTKNEVFWDVHWFTMEEAKSRLENAGISIPFPQRDVHIVNNEEKKSVLEKSS